MNCSDCGAEIQKGCFYCGGCGRPVGFSPTEVATLDEEPGLSEVPEPKASLEAPKEAPVETSFRTRVSGKALCSMCMGAFPETVLTVVEGKPYCPDCSPLIGQRRDPEVQQESAEPDYVPDSSLAPPPPIFREQKSGGGAKGILAVVVLVALGGAGFLAFTLLGGDRIDALISGVDTSRSEAYMLEQSYLPGESLYYNAGGKITGEGSVSGIPMMMGGGGDMAIDMKIFTGVEVEALSVDEQGNAELRVTTQKVDMDGEVSFNGQTIPLNGLPMPRGQGMGGESTVIKVDAFGEPVGGNTGEALPDFFSGQFGKLPRDYLKVGDTWSASVSMNEAAGALPPGMPMPDLSFHMDYRVEGFKRIAGRDCMVISMKGGLTGGDSIVVPMVGEIQADMDMKGAIFFDVAAKCLVKVAIDITLDFGASSDNGGIDIDAKLEFDVDLQ